MFDKCLKAYDTFFPEACARPVSIEWKTDAIDDVTDATDHNEVFLNQKIGYLHWKRMSALAFELKLFGSSKLPTNLGEVQRPWNISN